MISDYEKCIDCGMCTRNCLFLKKYGLNLRDYFKRPDLAYNCYLCGKCKELCPVDIDGKEISLHLRRSQLDSGYSLYSNGYAMMVLEKKNYIFKNYKRAKSGTVLFPGCNFPAYYPETLGHISRLLEDEFNISTVFDCCGKPIFDLGMEGEEEVIRERLSRRFEELGIKELILLCPNCYSYFKNNSNIKVSMIYEHGDIMKSLVAKGPDQFKGFIFMPCPDREAGEIYSMLDSYVDLENLEEIKDIQCCGAGGCASIKEGDLTRELQDGFKNYQEKIYVYCATCSAMIGKSNGNVEHILCSLIDKKEEPSKGINSLKNRALFSLKK